LPEVLVRFERRMQCLPSGEEQDEADDAASVADPAKRLANPAN